MFGILNLFIKIRLPANYFQIYEKNDNMIKKLYGLLFFINY